MKEEIMSNHLKNGYSNYVFLFIKKHNNDLFINDKILDVGAGHYRNLKLFHELGFKNLHAIDIVKSNNPLKVPLNFSQGNIEYGLPYKDREFNIVLCNYVLMFINPEKQLYVLSELMRVSNKFLIIETNKYINKVVKDSLFKEYDFSYFVNYIKSTNAFDILSFKNERVIQRIMLKRRL